jgi:hypothetical protein
MIAYVDSSVLLSLVLAERDPLDVLLGPHERVTSLLTEVECLRALETARWTGRLTVGEACERRIIIHDQLRRMRRIALVAPVVRRAGEAFSTPLKALDALHMATALVWRERRAPELVFATHDLQQARAAAALGFEVVGV